MSDQIANQDPDRRPGDQPAEEDMQKDKDTELLPVTTTPIGDDAEETGATPTLAFNIVGLGASAGGVEAFIEIFQHLSPYTGMAYVLITHTSAEQKSHLVEIISRHTRMAVVEIDQGIAPEPDRVYIPRPGNLVRLRDGLFELEPLGIRPVNAIDVFFRSLASAQKSRSVAVVLSGMDGDGALGMRAVKGEGGITIVQSPESARFPDMPRTTMSTDHVDAILPPRGIAGQLERLSDQFRSSNFRLLEDGATTSAEERYFARILATLRGVSGVDFRLYKPGTIRRRIARRMLLHRIETYSEYSGFLQSNPPEARELHEDVLINVTYFFRDTDVFEALRHSVLPLIMEDRDPGQQLRVWVAGCSTGEEVYSIAIAILEYLTGSQTDISIQIFGTDASESSIQFARTGNYPESITSEVSAERLRRFFTKTDKGYQVAKRVRDLCIFARQNLCHDPPFSRMDLISCRNVLIYFGAQLQRQLIPTFHYALRQHGFLLLGASEAIREYTHLFSLFDRRNKFYQRIGADQTHALVDVTPRVMILEPAVPHASKTDGWGDLELQRAADRIVLARYGPAGVIVNDRLEIVQSRGHMSPYLEMPQGAATLQLARMAREHIAHHVVAAVRRAIENDSPVQVNGVRGIDGSQGQTVTIEVLPIDTVSHHPKWYLILFVPAEEKADVVRSVETPEVEEQPADKDKLIAQLRQDVAGTRLYLQSLLEERDAKNQELVSANEEIQSANEELQSTNEELETTKEELQSANEELHTVNEELQNRNAYLTQASNDLQNLLTSVNLPLLMLGSRLDIRHFTPPTQRVMNLRPTDVGRPFSEIRLNLQVDDLNPVFLEVLETLAPRELEVRDTEGHWYLMRVRPYRTTDNKIDGLVVVLVDIDQLRRTQQEMRAARDFASSVIACIPLPLAVVDGNFRIHSANDAFSALTGQGTGEPYPRLLPDMMVPLFGPGNALRKHLESLRDDPQPTKEFRFEQTTKGDPERVFSISGRDLQTDHQQYFLVTFEDITSHTEAERLLKSTTTALGRSQGDLRALTSSLLTSQETERRRIARELHDDIGQRLAQLEIETDQARDTLPSSSDTAAERIEQIRVELARLSEDVRNISHRLHPATIENLGLAAALRALTEDIDRKENLIATFESSNVPDDISFRTATSLYRIAQESLRNAVKHAGRTHVRVELRGGPDGLRLIVSDAGKGFDLEQQRAGLGLISIEERARVMGGNLNIQSEPARGTTITVHVPAEELTDERES